METPSRPKLSELVRTDLSKEYAAATGMRRAEDCGRAPVVLQQFYEEAALLLSAAKKVGTVLGSIASDSRVPRELRYVALFWNSVLNMQTQSLDYFHNDFAWWFEPAIGDPGDPSMKKSDRDLVGDMDPRCRALLLRTTSNMLQMLAGSGDGGGE